MGGLKNITKLQFFLIICIFLLGTLMRLVDLGKIPIGFTNDEANVGYDAYSILKTGKDQWGQQQPNTYLKGFGDYRPPLYTYAAIPSIALFGLNEFAVRLPSAIAGSLTILCIFFLAELLWRNRIISIFSMFFLAFNPWHIGMSRIGIESNFGVFIITLAFIFFLLGINNKKFLYGSMILFGISVYTYTSYVVLSPLLVITAFFIYRKPIFTNKKTAYIAIAIFVATILPLLLGGSLKTASVRSKQVNLTSDIGIVNVVNDKRGECQVDFQNKVCQILQNKYTAFASVFVYNYLNHFSPELLVSNGTVTQYSILPERGLLYITEYIFFIFGLIFLLKKKDAGSLLVLGWILLAPIPDSITSAGHYSRFMPIIPTVQLTGAAGVFWILSVLGKKRQFLLSLVIPVILYEILSFTTVYWSYFPRFYASYSHYGYKSLMHYLRANENKYDKIIVSSSVNDTKQYVFYLFFNKYDPALFQSGKGVVKVVESNGWLRTQRIGKVYFLPALNISPEDVKKSKLKTLLAGAKSEFPKGAKIKYTIKDPKNNIIFVLVDLTSVYTNVEDPGI